MTGTNCPNATAQVIVNIETPPNAGSNGTLNLCQSAASVDLFNSLTDTPDTGGTWDLGGLNVSNMLDPATAMSGTYTYTVTGTNCPNATAQVIVNIESPRSAGSNSTLDICINDSPVDLRTLLNGASDTAGTWEHNTNTVSNIFDPAVDPAGIYRYTVSGMTCSSDFSEIEITKKSSSVLPPFYSADNIADACQNTVIADSSVVNNTCAPPNLSFNPFQQAAPQEKAACIGNNFSTNPVYMAIECTQDGIMEAIINLSDFTTPPGANFQAGLYGPLSQGCPNGMLEAMAMLRACEDDADENNEVFISYSGALSGEIYYLILDTEGEQGVMTVIMNAPLPIELINLQARATENEHILISWITASEIENDGFFLYRRSETENSFQKIGWVDGAGNSNEQLNYQFIDKNVKKGINYYYYLEDIDFEGNSNQSDVVNAKVQMTSQTIEIHPNPIKNQATVLIQSDSKEMVVLSICDVAGRVIYSKEVELDTGANFHEIDVANFADGMYFIYLNERIFKTAKRFVKY